MMMMAWSGDDVETPILIDQCFCSMYSIDRSALKCMNIFSHTEDVDYDECENDGSTFHHHHLRQQQIT